MEDGRTQVYCGDCERWLAVPRGQEQVNCDCGRRFVVTVTEIPARLV